VESPDTRLIVHRHHGDAMIVILALTLASRFILEFYIGTFDGKKGEGVSG
jgi:hypothetical protein